MSDSNAQLMLGLRCDKVYSQHPLLKFQGTKTFSLRYQVFETKGDEILGTNIELIEHWEYFRQTAV